MRNQFLSLRQASKGFTLIQLLVWVLIASAVFGGFFYLLNSEHAKTRDAKRLADMSRVQAAFEFLFAQNASFAKAADGGCNTVGVHVNLCKLSSVIPDIATLSDPGSFSYVVSRVPDDEGYQVTFQLERSYGNLKAGAHAISQDGFQ